MNFDKKLKELQIENCIGDHTMYKLSDMLKNFTVVPVTKGLYAIEDNQEHWIDVCFMTLDSSMDNEEFLSELFRSSGTLGCLRECRHTYFPDDGYVFYMNKGDMVAALEYLEKYFDMD